MWNSQIFFVLGKIKKSHGILLKFGKFFEFSQENFSDNFAFILQAVDNLPTSY